MNVKILAEYNGKEFELVVGQEYEFSNFDDFCEAKTCRLTCIMGTDHQFVTCYDYCYKYIRPIQEREV